jgi:dihydrolipoamide dehydrogenase
VKIVADKSSDLVLGVHIVGAEASDMISEAALAIEMGATLEDIGLTIHPHPTLPESIMEASEAAKGKPIHIVTSLRSQRTSN